MRIVASALANCVLFVGLLFFMLPSLTRAESPRDCTLPNAEEPAVPQTLRVALYPYTPDRLALFHKIESLFECENPGVNVVLVSSSNATDKYYNDDPTKQEGFLYVDADIYEIDTILLSDFIARGKIAAIELPFNDFLRESIEAVTRNGQTFAVPHWMCGNFLFYRKTDTELAEVKTWGELRTLLHRRGQSLFVDLKGKSTIGEWYFTSLVSIVGVDGAQRHIVEGEPINADAVDRLQDMLAMCPIGYCRSDKLHDKVGFTRGHSYGGRPLHSLAILSLFTMDCVSSWTIASLPQGVSQKMKLPCARCRAFAFLPRRPVLVGSMPWQSTQDCLD